MLAKTRVNSFLLQSLDTINGPSRASPVPCPAGFGRDGGRATSYAILVVILPHLVDVRVIRSDALFQLRQIQWRIVLRCRRPNRIYPTITGMPVLPVITVLRAITEDNVQNDQEASYYRADAYCYVKGRVVAVYYVLGLEEGIFFCTRRDYLE